MHVIVALDLDGVVADISEALGQRDARAFVQPGFFASLRPVRGAVDGIAALRRVHTVLVCSSAMLVPHAFNEKFDWLRRVLPALDPASLVFCGSKAVIAADVLVDDSPHELRAFSGRGILFTTGANARDPYPDRARDWLELRAMLGA